MRGSGRAIQIPTTCPSVASGTTTVASASPGASPGASSGASPGPAPEGTSRSITTARTATPIAMTAAMAEVRCIPCTNAPRATSSRAPPIPRGSCPTTPTAPPSVSRATTAAPAGTPAGRSPASSPRYTAMPMLPRTAIPSAPPSSAPVSEIPDAAPARSGGADPTIKSVVRVNTGASPREMISDAMTSGPRPPDAADLGEHDQADGRHRQAGRDDVRRANRAHDPRSQLRPQDETNAPRAATTNPLAAATGRARAGGTAR